MCIPRSSIGFAPHPPGRVPLIFRSAATTTRPWNGLHQRPAAALIEDPLTPSAAVGPVGSIATFLPRQVKWPEWRVGVEEEPTGLHYLHCLHCRRACSTLPTALPSTSWKRNNSAPLSVAAAA